MFPVDLKKTMAKVRLIAFAPMICLFFVACTPPISQPPPAPDGKARIMATSTTGMITDLVKKIGGDYVFVSGLMGAGTDPHLYKAREADIRLLAYADVVFYNGLHLEGKLGDVLHRLARKKPVIAVSEKIDRSRLRRPPEFEGHYDPHIWFDVTLWIDAAKQIRSAFVELDPDRKEHYEKNAAKLMLEMEQLHQWIGVQIATIPKERRVLITAHDAFGYFGRTYNIEVRGIQGISTEDEAGVSEINGLVDFIAQRGIKAVFVESSVPRKNVEALIEGAAAKNSRITIGGELFSDAMGVDGTQEGTYIGMVRHNVNTIVSALK